MIRRLEVGKDFKLFREAYKWERRYPRWLRDAEKVARLRFKRFILEAPKRADIGAFNPEFVALISVLRRAPKIFEAHVWAKRGTRVENLTQAGLSIRESLQKEVGMDAAYVWIVERNIPVKRLCQMIGFEADGAFDIDGESHGRPIKWIRLVLNRGKEEDRTKHESEF